MSIQEVLEGHLLRGDLVRVPPISGSPEVRFVFTTASIFEELDPMTASSEYNESAGNMRAKLEAFSTGRRIVVGRRNTKDCDMKFLEPKQWNVWEIRQRLSPSIRLFGSFIEKDSFFVTNIQFVKILFGVEWSVKQDFVFWPVWHEEMKNCRKVWRRFFAQYKPLYGNYLDDYISNADSSGAF